MQASSRDDDDGLGQQRRGRPSKRFQMPGCPKRINHRCECEACLALQPPGKRRGSEAELTSCAAGILPNDSRDRLAHHHDDPEPPQDHATMDPPPPSQGPTTRSSSLQLEAHKAHMTTWSLDLHAKRWTSQPVYDAASSAAQHARLVTHHAEVQALKVRHEAEIACLKEQHRAVRVCMAQQIPLRRRRYERVSSAAWRPCPLQ